MRNECRRRWVCIYEVPVVVSRLNALSVCLSQHRPQKNSMSSSSFLKQEPKSLRPQSVISQLYTDSLKNRKRIPVVGKRVVNSGRTNPQEYNDLYILKAEE